jgi:hypothetical protein
MKCATATQGILYLNWAAECTYNAGAMAVGATGIADLSGQRALKRRRAASNLSSKLESQHRFWNRLHASRRFAEDFPVRQVPHHGAGPDWDTELCG